MTITRRGYLGLISGATLCLTGTVVAAPLFQQSSRAPRHVLGVYWTRWSDDTPITAIPRAYNVIYLFGAKSHPDGSVTWKETNIDRDVAVCRARGQRIILALGGAGQGIIFKSRDMSRNLVDSVQRINRQLSGTLNRPMIDGVDFNTYERNAHPDTAEYLWMARELRQRFGDDLAISSPPAPWSLRDMRFCREMLRSDAMNYVAPQFYGGRGLTDPDYILRQTTRWVEHVADGDASRIAVGFGMRNARYYSSLKQVRQSWAKVHARYPDLRGAYVWHHTSDHAIGWATAKSLSTDIN